MAYDEPDEMRTSDLYYASFLLASGAKMSRTDRAGSRFFFVFELPNAVDLQALQQGWVNNTAEVPAQGFTHWIKSLKATVHGS